MSKSTATFDCNFTIQLAPDDQPGVLVNGVHCSVLAPSTQPDGSSGAYTVLQPYHPPAPEVIETLTRYGFELDLFELPQERKGEPLGVDNITVNVPTESVTRLAADEAISAPGTITVSNKHFRRIIPISVSSSDQSLHYFVTEMGVPTKTTPEIPFSLNRQNSFQLKFEPCPGYDVSSTGRLGDLLQSQTKIALDADAAWLTGVPEQRYELRSLNTIASGTNRAPAECNFELVL